MTTFAALFNDSKHAGLAVSELKEAGYTDDISVIAKKWDEDEASTTQVKQNIEDGAAGGAAAGAIIGTLTALVGVVSNIAIPGIGPLLVGGPIATLLGGAATGAAAGGILGALVDLGIPEKRAQMYEEYIRKGDILVTVTADSEDASKIESIFRKHGALEYEINSYANV